jgi:hypothetical protein
MNLIDSQSKSGRMNISSQAQKFMRPFLHLLTGVRSHPSGQHSIHCIWFVTTCTHRSVVFAASTKPRVVDVMLNYEMYDPATILKTCPETIYQITFSISLIQSHIESETKMDWYTHVIILMMCLCRQSNMQSEKTNMSETLEHYSVIK